MTTFRADARTQLKALLDDFRDAHATHIAQTYSNRPASFGSTPLAYVGGINEPRILHTSGIRQRDVEVQLVLVDVLTDNEETAARLDVLADDLLDALTAAPNAISAGTVQEPVRMAAAELDVGGVTYAAIVISVLARVQEPRT